MDPAPGKKNIITDIPVIQVGHPEDNKIGTGSGFLWDNNGNILTNYHVIQPAVSNDNPIIVARTINNDEYLANIVGLDSSADLAIIKIYFENQFIL